MKKSLQVLRFRHLLEPTALLLVLLMSLAAGVFVWTAYEMQEGETMMRDRQWLLALRVPGDVNSLLGGAPALQLAQEITALGSPWFLVLLVGSVGGVLIAMQERRLALFILAATSGGALFNTGLKHWFERARPSLVPHDVIVSNASFPSGHAFGAAMVYLTLAVLLTFKLQTRAVRVILLALAMILAFAVGVSRVALGVHWPSDVLAGWTAGSAWALASWLIANATGWFNDSDRRCSA